MHSVALSHTRLRTHTLTYIHTHSLSLTHTLSLTLSLTPLRYENVGAAITFTMCLFTIGEQPMTYVKVSTVRSYIILSNHFLNFMA